MLARVFFTYAKLDYRDRIFFSKVVKRLTSSVTELGARDIGMVAFAVGTLKLKDTQLLGHLTVVASKKLPDFTPSGLTTLVWGLGTLEAEVDPQAVR